MSFFVHSDDFEDGGSSSDGTWSFQRSLRGNWNVIGQHMNTQDFPWMFNGTNTMVMTIHDPMNDLISTTFEINFNPTIGLESDIATIAADMVSEMQGTIDAVAVDDPYAARTVSESHDTSTIVFHFDVDPVDINWQGFPSGPFYSTINAALGRSSSTPDELKIQDLTVSTHNMDTDPKYLEVYISESNTQYATSHGTLPTLLFSTRDGEFDNQTFSVPTDSRTLTIQIKRMSNSEVVPLTGQWFLIFQSAA